MKHLRHPLVLLVSMAIAIGAQAAKPAPAKAAKAEPAPVAKVELALAHNLGAVGQERLAEVIERFNSTNSDGSVRLARLEKGEKPGPLNLVRRYEMDDVLSQPARFVPLYQVMGKAGQPLNVKDLSEDLKAGVTDAKGRFVALPVAYATPVLFYNKNAFRKARLDPEHPPRTWFEMQGVLDKLQDAGYTCPYTSAWPTWIHIDNMSALSGVPAVSDKGALTFNGLPQVKHIAMMSTWVKANYFKLFGRGGEANKKFEDGECAVITTDSWEYTRFREAAGVELGVALLPYHEDVFGGRQSTLADGASLWIGAGYSPAEYKVAAKFVAFLLTPEMQVELSRGYGTLPLTGAARSALASKILRDGDESLKVAYASLNGKGARSPVRVANIDSVRTIVDAELEAVWANRKPAKAALDTAVNLGNAVLAAKPALKKAQPF